MTIAAFKSHITALCAKRRMDEDLKDDLLAYIEEKIEGRQSSASPERRTSFLEMIGRQRGQRER